MWFLFSLHLSFFYLTESYFSSRNLWIFTPKIGMLILSVLSEYSLFYPSMDKRARIWGTLTSLLTFPSHRSFFQEAFGISNGWLSIFSWAENLLASNLPLPWHLYKKERDQIQMCHARCFFDGKYAYTQIATKSVVGRVIGVTVIMV